MERAGDRKGLKGRGVRKEGRGMEFRGRFRYWL